MQPAPYQTLMTSAYLAPVAEAPVATSTCVTDGRLLRLGCLVTLPGVHHLLTTVDARHVPLLDALATRHRTLKTWKPL